jgi:hypothetical protein
VLLVLVLVVVLVVLVLMVVMSAILGLRYFTSTESSPNTERRECTAARWFGYVTSTILSPPILLLLLMLLLSKATLATDVAEAQLMRSPPVAVAVAAVLAALW